MAVDRHPSRSPGLPRKPPPTSTTDGQPNTVGKTMQGPGIGEVEYGSRNGKHLSLKIVHDHGSERAHDFMGFSEGKAPKPGHEAPNEGKASRAKRPGDEKGDDEPG
jgi:hypothetical protein